MKNLILFISVLLIVSSCSNSIQEDLLSMDEYSLLENKARKSLEDYYWYHNTKVYLNPITSQKFILQEVDPLTRASMQLNEKTNVLSDNAKCSSLKGKNVVWSITRNSTRISESEVIYESPIYLSSDDDTIAISHLFYVKLESADDYEKLQSLAEKNNVDIVCQNEYLPLWYTLSCSNKSTYNALRMSSLFYETGLFAASEPDIMLNLYDSMEETSIASLSINDTYYGNQWNLNAINWPSAYSLSKGDNVKVGLIDQGMEDLHPDYERPNGFDTLNPTVDSQNIVYGSHGTACAGIICATVNNGKGVAGIADKVEMLSVCHPLVKRPNAIEELSTGLIVAIQNSDVVSCSWGNSDLKSSMIEDAFIYMKWGRDNKGTVVVFSTGNDNGEVIFPANCNDEILTVGSIGKNYKRSSFSNYGTQLDIVAPGENIPTTDLLSSSGYDTSDYYMNFSGTSAACPHVAAVAAMVISVNPQLTGKQVRDIIESTAQKIGGYSYEITTGRENGTWNNEMGYGLLDAYAAVLKAEQTKSTK